ncbi:PREDICTED: tektin-2-like [Amphimedon queenslandica]|uniref:Tektin n=1 Tax=Amphimedon queenslandica TaxID=400682 RepID=A0A1X7VFU1_AMPQE|nr:PREDICTED: tektin-2-like [Amphimedon queenslandica]|eukprot:XP_003384329.1 PREDICTED: tektin-2-like [Amphimedon queenslandica]
MATAYETSPTKYAPSDWTISNEVIQSSAERQRLASHRIRQESNQTRNETSITTKWTQHSNDTSLHQRISDVTDWKSSLQHTLSETDSAITKLSESKRLAEYALMAKEMPLHVVLECLVTRENRVAIDLVRDEVEAELNKEVSVIEGVQAILHQRIGDAFKQLCQLQECYEKLQFDISDKTQALSIDTDCVGLGNSSSGINIQTDPTRIKKGIVNPVQWESYSVHNTDEANREIAQSVRLRESISQTIQQTTNDLESQWTATNYALRRRIHEIKQAYQELEWQKKNTEAEIAQVKQEIESLTVSLMEKTPPMKVAHTRLENRTYRQNVELCRDQPQYNLVEEISEITTSQKKLAEKLHVSKQTLGTLQRTLERIMKDLSVKSNSLQLDKKCEEIRQILSKHPKPHQLPQLVKEAMEEKKDENNKNP